MTEEFPAFHDRLVLQRSIRPDPEKGRKFRPTGFIKAVIFEGYDGADRRRVYPLLIAEAGSDLDSALIR